MSGPTDQDVQRDDDGYRATQISLDDALAADAEDETLQKWKESLIGDAQEVEGGTKLTEIALIFKDHDPIVFDLSQPDQDFVTEPVPIKEGSVFRFRLRFQVADDILSGLTMVNAVYRMGIRGSREQYSIGSAGPGEHERVYPRQGIALPTGFFARATYRARCAFSDDDNHTWADFNYSFRLTKEWE